jgi:AraC-like DNA-binding protein
MACLTSVFYGRQFRSAFTLLPRHRHPSSYLALVLSGGYEEAGDRGRRQVGPGDVVMHGAFEAHLNRYHARGSEVLCLALPRRMEPGTAVMRVPDSDRVVRLAERDPKEAVRFLLTNAEPSPGCLLDWPDELARELARDPQLRLQDWARRHCLADATVSRGFRQVFGITPSAFRAQLRGRIAWQRVLGCGEPLAFIATDSGFFDQAHMTRTVRALTGRPPGAWRQPVK